MIKLLEKLLLMLARKFKYDTDNIRAAIDSTSTIATATTVAVPIQGLLMKGNEDGTVEVTKKRREYA
eukprot:3224550-Ditylum_brightwellii.AAC.1